MDYMDMVNVAPYAEGDAARPTHHTRSKDSLRFSALPGLEKVACVDTMDVTQYTGM